MYVLIGDIGNTISKICLLEKKTFKVKKILYLNSSKIIINEYLKKNFKKIFLNKKINRFALISSVVPKAFKRISKIFISLYFFSKIASQNLPKGS